MNSEESKRLLEEAHDYYQSVTRYDFLNGLNVIGGYFKLFLENIEKGNLTKDDRTNYTNNIVQTMKLLLYSAKEYSCLISDLKKQSCEGTISPVSVEKYRHDQAKSEDNIRLFLSIVKRMTDRSEFADKLADIANNGPHYSDMASAVEIIQDQTIVCGIAVNHANSLIRKKAVERITNQGILKEIAKTDPDSGVRMSAVERIEDKDFLQSVAQEDKDGCVRIKALETLHDETTIKVVAEKDSEEFVRRRAGEILKKFEGTL